MKTRKNKQDCKPVLYRLMKKKRTRNVLYFVTSDFYQTEKLTLSNFYKPISNLLK
jgi:hypothetical protein